MPTQTPSVSAAIQYHLVELAIAQNPLDPRYAMPDFSDEHRVILDIGCGVGQTFVAAGLNQPANPGQPQRTLLALDIEEEVLLYGRAHYQGIHYIRAEGAVLPFADDSIDLVISRVSLPHTHLPQAVQEIARVLKPGGECWITLHPLHMALERLLATVKRFSLKSLLFQCYVLTNGLYLHSTGRVFAFPFTTRYESFQTRRATERLFSEPVFEGLRIQDEPHFLVTVRKRPR